MAVAERLESSVEGADFPSSRVGVVRLKGRPMGVSFVVAYTSTEVSDAAAKDEFYALFASPVEKEKKVRRVVVVVGDFNAR